MAWHPSLELSVVPRLRLPRTMAHNGAMANNTQPFKALPRFLPIHRGVARKHLGDRASARRDTDLGLGDVTDDQGLEIGDLGVDSVTTADPFEPRPGIKPFSVLAVFPEVDTPTDAGVAVDEVFTQKPRRVREPRSDLGKIL